MQTNESKVTVYFDGSCPLCDAEIGHYRRADHAAHLCLVDLSDKGEAPPSDLTRDQAMRRFHVRTRSGKLVSGALAFVEVWRHLPGWRWLSRAAAAPGALPLLELGYRVFLPMRPVLSRVFGRLKRSRRSVHPAGW